MRNYLLPLSLFMASCSGGSDEGSTSAFDPGSLSGSLQIAVSESGPTRRLAFETAVSQFQTIHPELTITTEIREREAHNEQLTTLLTGETPDVVSLRTGHLFREQASLGQLDDLSGLWADAGLLDSLASSINTATVNDRQWSVPYSHYQWGIYYRRDLFDELSLQPPTDWDSFQSVADTLLQNNITPLTIGTRFRWPAAAYFDHLNLRINGYQVHADLTAGRVPYTDGRIRQVFEQWREMVDAGYFIEGHEDMTWMDAITPLLDGEAAMYLMGSFLVDAAVGQGLDRANIGFFRFPDIPSANNRPDTIVSPAEEAPAEALGIPANATNKPAARAFLAFMAQANTQATFNTTVNDLPTNRFAPAPTDPLLAAGFDQLNAATGLTQFLDRDAPPDMVSEAFEGFLEFMLDTTTMDTVLQRLETVRGTVYELP